MCEPVTTGIAIAGLVLSAGGTAYQIYSDEKQADEEEKAAKKNKFTSYLMASDAMMRGEQAAGQARTEGTQIIGEQRATFGASGLDVGVGQPAKLQAETRLLSELDAAILRSEAARDAWGYKVQGMEYGALASATSNAARRKRNADAVAGAGSTLVTAYNTFK